MSSIITPKRRQLTRRARRIIEAMVDTRVRRTGGTSANTMIGLAIRRGMLGRELERFALVYDRLRTGVIKVPRMSQLPPASPMSIPAGM